MISVRDNLKEADRILSDLGRKQLPFAAAMALTETANDAKSAWEAEIERRLDRPTPFTKRGVYRKGARKSRLVAEVGLKPIQSEYLSRLVMGGTDRPDSAALVMPVQQKRNRYGNLPKGALKRAIARDRVFVGRINGQGGVWQRPSKAGARRGDGPKLLIAFRSKATYQPSLPLPDVAEATGIEVFPGHFRAWLIKAIQSAK